ncbi:MAG: hypothetical protein GOVbin212_45 [Prokaryotic dsDNA virus sp.]|nr:MAG: hypothetical protein GOVbin212_45 [Prokaryotic dsDNA virus sp.]|tara:strand:- start:20916 stop:21269 length:354 start_codon:yes stop_codon:yes gene_type:complete
MNKYTNIRKYRDIKNILEETEIKSLRTFNSIIKPLGIKLSSAKDYYIWDSLSNEMENHISQLYTDAIHIYRFDASCDKSKVFWISELEDVLTNSGDYHSEFYDENFNLKEITNQLNK